MMGSAPTPASPASGRRIACEPGTRRSMHSKKPSFFGIEDEANDASWAIVSARVFPNVDHAWISPGAVDLEFEAINRRQRP